MRNTFDLIRVIQKALCASCVVLSVLLTLALPAKSQTSAPAEPGLQPDRGTRPNGSYSISDLENISLTNGNLNLSIPLASLPPSAGGKLSWTINAIYNSKLVDVKSDLQQADINHSNQPYFVKYLNHSDQGGWQLSGRYEIEQQLYDDEITGCVGAFDCNVASYRYKYFLVMPDGARHELRPLDSAPCSVCPAARTGYFNQTPGNTGNAMRYYSFDGSYLWAVIYPANNPTKWTVYMKDGTHVTEYDNGDERIYDTNGNSVLITTPPPDNDGNTTTHYVDERSNREIILYHPFNSDNDEVRYQTVGGTWVTITVTWGKTSLQGLVYNVDDRACAPSAREHTAMLNVIRSITLPLTEPCQTTPCPPPRSFTFAYNSDPDNPATAGVPFTYNLSPSCTAGQAMVNAASGGWGQLRRMTMPTGAVVDYAWEWDNVPNKSALLNATKQIAGATLTQKKVTYDNGQTAIWTYSINEAVGIVIAPDSSVSTESFYSHDPYKTSSLAGANGLGGLVYRSDRAGKIRIERQWALKTFNGAYAASPEGTVNFNNILLAEYTSLMENGSAVKMSAKTFEYDFNGNLTKTTEYDWFDPALIVRDTSPENLPTGIPGSATVRRVTTTAFYNPAPSAGDSTVYAKRQAPVPSATSLIVNAPQETITGPSKTQFCYDDTNPAGDLTNCNGPGVGNLTRIGSWDNVTAGGQWLITRHQYDSYGNRIQTTDPLGNATLFEFGDSTQPGKNSRANVTKIIRSPCPGVPAPPCQQATTMTYDFDTGASLTVTDPNGATTTTSYTNNLLNAPDPFLRPGLVTGPGVITFYDGAPHGTQQQKVRTTYYDNDRRIVTESDQNMSVPSDDWAIKTETRFDQLGRAVRRGSHQTTEAAKWTITDTQFDPLGRVARTYNPYTADNLDGAVNQSAGWTQNTYDSLSRVTAVQTPDIATVTTEYYANQVMVTDQAGKKRMSETDGLGRLTRVWEIRGTTSDSQSVGLVFGGTTYYAYPTQYTYDDRNNLTRVRQGKFGLSSPATPVQFRAFYYDSLSRLLYANNPEQDATIEGPAGTFWTMKYEYDKNSNLIKRTDARKVVTNYTHDALNRNLTVDYSNTPTINPDIQRNYDTATNGVGRLASTVSRTPDPRVTTNPPVLESQTIISSYDLMGRVRVQTQSFKDGNGPTTYSYFSTHSYDLAGDVTRRTYQDGTRYVDYAYGGGSRLTSLSGTVRGFYTYADNITYNPAGQMVSERFGTQTPLYHTSSYNQRFQMTENRLGTANNSSDRGKLTWQYGGTANNGNVLKQEHYVPLTGGSVGVPMSDDYVYDALNRLQQVTGNQITPSNVTAQLYKQAYSYDQFGNRKIDAANTSGNLINNQVFRVNSLTNRLVGFSYDAAGNVVRDPGSLLTDTRQYDAENRMTQATLNYASQYYVYDGDGRRVRRIVNGTETWQVYGINGELLMEYAAGALASDAQREYIYRAGQLLVTEDAAEVKWTVADHLGTPRMTVGYAGSLASVARHDYLPFGEELTPQMGGYGANPPAGLAAQSFRVSGYGYNTPDGVRQKFTGKERDGETGLDYFGARYYSSVQGRFTSADSPVMDLVPASPQSMNRYSYVRNNPCKNIDPNGRCSAPSGLKPGQTGICVEAFIATRLLPGFMAIATAAKGDNRGPSGTDSNLTYRVHSELIINPKKQGKGHDIINRPAKAGVSETFLAARQGTAETSVTNQNTDQKTGTTNFTLSGTAKNGFQAAGWPGAPAGTIDFNLNFAVTKDGSVSVNKETSTTKEYPTYEAYSYQVDNQGKMTVTQLFVRTERDIDALTREQTPIKEKNK